MAVYVWNDLSPQDDCSLVQFTMSAGSLTEVARAVNAALPAAKITTTTKLPRDGFARKAASDEQEPAASQPGIHWSDNGEDWHTA